MSLLAGGDERCEVWIPDLQFGHAMRGTSGGDHDRFTTQSRFCHRG